MTPPKPQPSTAVLREAATMCIDAARRLNVTKLRAEYVDAATEQRVEVIVTADWSTPDGDHVQERVDEHVTVKVGPASRATTVIAAPADWVTV